MPGRLIPLVTDEIYHVVNRGIDDRPTFSSSNELNRILLTTLYYKFKFPPLRLSYFLNKSLDEQKQIINSLKKENRVLVDILCYCFMPNHFHLLLRQKVDKGISKYMSNFQNSYTRYFNTRSKRKGPLFYDQFKAVRVKSDEQLLHVSRYIHLNPYSGYVVKDKNDLLNYPWSSLPEYLNRDNKNICETDTITSFFRSRRKYSQFILGQADYQRKLQRIKHLILEEEGL